MKRNRFSPATAALIAVLFGALYMVGKVVNPPPPGPPELPKPPPVVAAQQPDKLKHGQMSSNAMADHIKQEMDNARRMKVKEALELKLNNNVPLPKDDGITPEYFRDNPMGKAGLAKADKDAATLKRVTDEVNRRMALEHPRGSVLPTPGGASIPMSAAPSIQPGGGPASPK